MRSPRSPTRRRPDRELEVTLRISERQAQELVDMLWAAKLESFEPYGPTDLERLSDLQGGARAVREALQYEGVMPKRMS